MNLCIRVSRDRPAGLRPRFAAEASSLCTSDVVLSEPFFGADNSTKPSETRNAVDRFAARLTVLPLDSAAHAADIRAALERQGKPIGAYDLMVAGHARSKSLIVVAGNLREFDGVDGLRSEG